MAHLAVKLGRPVRWIEDRSPEKRPSHTQIKSFTLLHFDTITHDPES
ncbi:hypothetical protein [Streptomyces sp. CoH27]|nr:hypothetical protein [Streptomyces sp. CoH27]